MQAMHKHMGTSHVLKISRPTESHGKVNAMKIWWGVGSFIFTQVGCRGIYLLYILYIWLIPKDGKWCRTENCEYLTSSQQLLHREVGSWTRASVLSAIYSYLSHLHPDAPWCWKIYLHN